MLNARRHRSGENHVVGVDGRAGHRVLNARRHRSGENRLPLALETARSRGCSTPEGIGAARTRRGRKGKGEGRRCSTPEGIGAARTFAGRPSWWRVWCAQRPKASERREPQGQPGAPAPGVRAQRPKASERREPLQLRNSANSAYVCSTPEGIGAARTSWGSSSSITLLGAQRPKASERRERARGPRGRSEGPGVLNARRHRSGENSA